ncbi:MAG: hypothetical protein MHM6MM_004004 [Cercozoa sp. M6MM]
MGARLTSCLHGDEVSEIDMHYEPMWIRVRDATVRNANEGIAPPVPDTVVEDTLYLSGVRSAAYRPHLRRLQITHVVNVTRMPPLFPSDRTLSFLNIPIDDFARVDIRSHLPRAVRFMDDALENENARILVHCEQGISRSASVVLAWLLCRRTPRRFDDLPFLQSYDEALSFLRRRREIVWPNSGFRDQVREFAAERARVDRSAKRQATAERAVGRQERDRMIILSRSELSLSASEEGAKDSLSSDSDSCSLDKERVARLEEITVSLQNNTD